MFPVLGVAAVLSGCAAPKAVDDVATTAPGQSVTIPVLANDANPKAGALEVRKIPITPGKGTAIVNPDNTITYTPSTSAVGDDSFTYKMKSASGGGSIGRVTVHIVPLAPVAVVPAAPPPMILAAPQPPPPPMPPSPPADVMPMGATAIQAVRVTLRTLDDSKAMGEPVRIVVRRGDEVLADRTVGAGEAWSEDSERSFKLDLSRPVALVDASTLTLDIRKLAGGGPPTAWTLSASTDADLSDGRTVTLLAPTPTVQLGGGQPAVHNWAIPSVR